MMVELYHFYVNYYKLVMVYHIHLSSRYTYGVHNNTQNKKTKHMHENNRNIITVCLYNLHNVSGLWLWICKINEFKKKIRLKIDTLLTNTLTYLLSETDWDPPNDCSNDAMDRQRKLIFRKVMFWWHLGA